MIYFVVVIISFSSNEIKIEFFDVKGIIEMSKTAYQIQGKDFLINGIKTYADLPNSNPAVHGLLFNARFIQGIFEDKNPNNKGIYDRFGKKFDSEKHTDELIDHLPAWYEKGIRAITVGIQGGGPIFTYDNWSVIDTGAFSKDGRQMDEGYKNRLTRVIKACDDIGMIVIVSILYQAQSRLFQDGVAMMEAVRTSCAFLKSLPYDNIIIEIANEHDVGDFTKHPIISSSEGMGTLVRLAKEWVDNRFAVGSSGGGGLWKKEIVDNSDVILVHGNGLHREEYYRFIKQVSRYAPDKPIVCNEDSQCFSRLEICEATHTSWGYYNNMTKQEPPADWSITKGEDEYFSRRLEQLIYKKEDSENEYYLQGFEKDMVINHKRYVKLASLYPEKINFVEFYEDGQLLDIQYEEPFMLFSKDTWEQNGYVIGEMAKEFTAVIHTHSGEIIRKSVQLYKS